MKKLFLILIILAVSLLPIRAFAEESKNIVFNKYGVAKYDPENLKFSVFDKSYDPESVKSSYPFWSPNFFAHDVGGAICDSQTQQYFERSGNGDLIKKSCAAWVNKNKNSALIFTSDDNFSIRSAGFFIFTESNEEIKIKYNKERGYFALDMNKDLLSKTYAVYIRPADGGACYHYGDFCNIQNAPVYLSFGLIENILSSYSYTYYSPDYTFSEERKIFNVAGGNYYSRSVPVFNNYTVEYPEDYPEEDHFHGAFVAPHEINRIEDFYPRVSFSVKDKRLDAMILNLNSDNQQALDITHTRPSFSIYDEKKEREIFTYHGSNLADRFIYDFEEHGKYYLKTIVSQPPPMVLGEGKYKVHQPVWTEILIDGGSYAFFPNKDNNATCDGATCSLPDYAKSCVGRFEEISGSVGCEFRKLNDFLKSKLGFLWAPVDILTRTASNFQRANAVSCSVGQGSLTINACPISEKFPQLYAFLNMASNGVLLFGFVIFLRNQLSGFVSERGGE